MQTYKETTKKMNRPDITNKKCRRQGMRDNLVVCLNCNGNGMPHMENIICDFCAGTGSVIQSTKLPTT